MTHGSLFTGIGGFDLGFARAGIETVWQVEIKPYCQRVLERHFPKARRWGDVREFLADAGCERLPENWNSGGSGEVAKVSNDGSWNSRDVPDAAQFGWGQGWAESDGRWSVTGESGVSWVDIISGGFPCQPVSLAGKRQGEGDDRWLWPEMFRVVRTLRPSWVVAENVYGLVAHKGGELLDKVCDDLESEDYETLPPIVLPACAFGAPHRRDRMWIVARLQENKKSVDREGSVSMAHRAEPGLSQRQSEEGLRERTALERGGAVSDTDTLRRAGRTDDQRSSEARGNGAEDFLHSKGNTERTGLCSQEQAGQWWRRSGNADWWAVEPGLGGTSDGLSAGLDVWGPGWEDGVPRTAKGVKNRVARLEALGNSIVPQIAELIGRTILQVEREATASGFSLRG